MATIDITNIDRGSVIIEGWGFRDDTITFAATDTFEAGTILARDTSTSKLVLYVVGGSTNGNGVPCAVLPYELSRTGAGDSNARVLVAGRVNKKRLVVDAAGDDSTITAAVEDLLRARMIVPILVTQLSDYDNQP